MIKKLEIEKKLSILIPVYNYKVVDLVKKLYKQCERAKIEFEILVFDDLSDDKFKKQNKVVGSLFGVNYMELKENLGRSRIRNWLIKSARFDYVLFLDCDSKVNTNDFIKNYLAALQPGAVVNGGRKYAKSKPRAKSKYLHWYYGTKLESKFAKKRNKKPHVYFHSNNFAADRSIMVANPFDDKVEGYGYEDLLMARDLLDADVKIIHIDNPVIHLGLEKSDVFLDKTINAVDNLLTLNKKGIKLNTRLESFSMTLKDWSLENIFLKMMESRVDRYRENLTKENPKLWQLQALKLYHYLSNE